MSMRTWVASYYQDVKGNAKWALLWVIWWVVTKGGSKLLHLIPNIPNWLVSSILVLVGVVAFIWVARYNHKPVLSPTAISPSPNPQNPEILNPGMPPLSAITGKVAMLDDMTAGTIFGRAYFSPLTAEVEKNIKIVAGRISPNDKEAFYVRFIGVGLVGYMHDRTWWLILKSQILMMVELSRRAVSIPIADIKPFYDAAAASNQQAYSNYPFEGWLQWMVREQLVAVYPSNMVEISFRGHDFLRYLAHWGLDANAKPGSM